MTATHDHSGRQALDIEYNAVLCGVVALWQIDIPDKTYTGCKFDATGDDDPVVWHP